VSVPNCDAASLRRTQLRALASEVVRKPNPLGGPRPLSHHQDVSAWRNRITVHPSPPDRRMRRTQGRLCCRQCRQAGMTLCCRVAALQDLSHEERCLPKDVGAIGRTTSGRRPRQMTSLSRRWQAVLRVTRRGKRATGQEEIGVAGAQLRPPPVSAPQVGCVLINPTQCRVGVTQKLVAS
jgi:hypothetical protein